VTNEDFLITATKEEGADELLNFYCIHLLGISTYHVLFRKNRLLPDVSVWTILSSLFSGRRREQILEVTSNDFFA
jgi:hypothetical protein